jgi:hypothetical protein
MSTEYTHFLFPKDRTFRPATNALGLFVDRLQESLFLPNSTLQTLQHFECFLSSLAEPDKCAELWQNHSQNKESISKLRDSLDQPLEASPDGKWLQQFYNHDLSITWVVKSRGALGLRHPLLGHTADDCDYFFTIATTHDYEDVALNMLLGEIESTECPCGNFLELEVLPGFCFAGERKIAFRCSLCQEIYDPTNNESWALAWDSKTALPFKGGGVTRFSVSIDVGKASPIAPPRFDQDILQLFRESFKQEFVEAGEVG